MCITMWMAEHWTLNTLLYIAYATSDTTCLEMIFIGKTLWNVAERQKKREKEKYKKKDLEQMETLAKSDNSISLYLWL